jgi:hypothetical protein
MCTWLDLLNNMTIWGAMMWWSSTTTQSSLGHTIRIILVDLNICHWLWRSILWTRAYWGKSPWLGPTQEDSDKSLWSCQSQVEIVGCLLWTKLCYWLTDSHTRDSHDNSMHSVQKAKTSQTTPTDFNDVSNDDSNLRFILQSTCGKPLPANYKIPTQAWRLLSPEAKEAFIYACDMIIGSRDPRGGGGVSSPIPKQYWDAGHNKVWKAHLSVSGGEGNAQSDSEDSDDSDKVALAQLLKSYKASWNLRRFAGMVKTHPCTFHIPLTYVPSPLVSLHKIPLPSLTGCVTPAFLVMVHPGLLQTIHKYCQFWRVYCKEIQSPYHYQDHQVHPPQSSRDDTSTSPWRSIQQGELDYIAIQIPTLDSRMHCWQYSTSQLHRGIDGKPGTQQMITPDDDDDDDGTPCTIPLSLSDTLMTFTISLPTTNDLANLPIVDITPEGA